MPFIKSANIFVNTEAPFYVCSNSKIIGQKCTARHDTVSFDNCATEQVHGIIKTVALVYLQHNRTIQLQGFADIADWRPNIALDWLETECRNCWRCSTDIGQKWWNYKQLNNAKSLLKQQFTANRQELLTV